MADEEGPRISIHPPTPSDVVAACPTVTAAEAPACPTWNPPVEIVVVAVVDVTPMLAALNAVDIVDVPEAKLATASIPKIVPGVVVPTPTLPAASIVKGLVSFAASSNHAVEPLPKLEIKKAVCVPVVVVAIASVLPGVDVPIPKPTLVKKYPPTDSPWRPMARMDPGVDVPMPRLPLASTWASEHL